MRKIYSIIFLFIIFSVNAQECGTPSVVGNQSFATNANSNDASNSSYCINIKFHIVRQSDGSGGFDSNQLQTAMNLLNQYYENHNINFTNTGFDFINNSSLNNIGQTESSSKLNQLSAINNTANSLDVYIVDTAFYNGSAGNIVSKMLYLRSDRVLTETLAHEIGHCFNLYHTFHGPAEGSGCQENINGSNCTTCGDFVCDTPADANIGISGGYNPDLENLMCYAWWGNIRNHFSTQQGIRMRNALGGSSVLQNIINPTCAIVIYKLYGTSSLCTTPGPLAFVGITPTPPAGSNITWTTSANLSINTTYTPSTQNPNYVLVQNNATVNSYGTAYVYASINGNPPIEHKILLGQKPFSFNTQKTATSNFSEYCDYYYHYVSIDVINTDTEGNFTYTFSGLSAGISDSGITYTQTNPNRFLFKIPLNKIPSGSNPAVFMYSVSGNSAASCGATPPYTQNGKYVVLLNCGASGLTSQSNSPSAATISYYKIYPNPSSSVLNIMLSDNNTIPVNALNSQAVLYDINAIEKTRKNILNNTATLDVSQLTKGIYILKIIDNTGSAESHQVVIN